ncbi:glycerol dehydratase reactivase beta/small subunit family protein [Streptosporangium sp. NPDC002524]|uniref:glycerol dehydratase reactivase beta/small subunit family protein n=1 Tax=Streptosporangium sp. NPDC002524 TaxID=3154537 RepID=UPI003317A2EE
MTYGERNRPAVVVFCHPAPGNRQHLREIEAGMEEEGVPYRVEDGRADVGDGRVHVEDGRVGAEDGRVRVEHGRVGVGDGRVRAEDGRVGAEDGHVGSGAGGEAGGEARELAFAAAQASSLDVGVGVDAAGNICVHHAKLPPDAPAVAGTASDARVMGHNAARLVVGVPFKKSEQEVQVGSPSRKSEQEVRAEGGPPACLIASPRHDGPVT